MTNEKKRIEEIYHLALEKKNRKERSDYLDSACGNDSKLRASVEGLLQAHDKAGNFLEVPPFDPDVTLDTSPLTEGPGTNIGNYKLLEQIGEGGMAVVYMAEQKKPIRRKVALKIIKLGMDTKEVTARFEVERQALAMMEHPNIAKVLDAGTTNTGRPYFVMELVKGVSITDYCDKNKLTTKERLDLFISVCNAVQHAHQKGIIHRDIKPSNVMITLRDGKPVPKVIDFGIAKATSQRLTEKTLFTRYSQMIGTPAYMSPEQAEFSELDIDTRTDIYSLGVLIYELLTGTTPFSEEHLREAGYLEMQRIIREEEPLKPSTKLSTLGDTLTDVAEYRKVSPDLLQKLVRGDLDWIVMKSLEKDRTRRYATAAGLANDIARHLNHEPVKAAAPSVSYRLSKFVRRHRVGVVAALLVAAALSIGASVATVGFILAKIQRDQAVTNLQLANEALEREAQAVKDAKQAQAKEEESRKEAVKQRDAAYQNLYVAQIRLGHQYWQAGQITTLKEMLNGYIPTPGRADLRGWEWHYLLSLCHKDLLTIKGHNRPVGFVAWSPDGNRIASASADKTAKVWDAMTGKELITLHGHSGALYAVAWSPDGKYIAAGCGDGTIKLWDATAGEEFIVLHGHTGRVSSMAWSPDGNRIASGSDDTTARIWETETGEEILTLRGLIGGLSAITWSPDGQRFVTGQVDVQGGNCGGIVKVWEISTGQEIFSWCAYRFDLWTVAWSPDGTRLATGSNIPIVKIWDAKTGNMLLRIPHDAGVESIDWSPDSKYIASTTRSQKVIVWDANTGQEVRAFRGHAGWVNCVAWSPDGKRLASGGNDGMVKVWDTGTDQQAMVLPHPKAWTVAWSPNGGLLASSGGGEVKVWDSTGNKVLSWTFQIETDVEMWIAWSPDEKYLVTGRWDHLDRAIKIWDATTGEETATAPAGSRPSWSPNGQFLAIACGRTVEIWDPLNKEMALLLRGHKDRIYAVSWSPDGKRLASAGFDGLILVWDAMTGDNILILRGHDPGKWIGTVAWDPDSKLLASGGFNQKVKVWDTSTGHELHSLDGHTGAVFSVAWAPDGRRIVSGSKDTTAKIWDAAQGQELLTLRGHSEEVSSVSWSPDGRCLATAGPDGQIKLWDASEGYEISPSTEYLRKRFSSGDLIAWWKFDQVEGKTVLDSSGNNLNGKLLGDANIVSDPERGTVLSLDGSGDYVDFGNNSAFNIFGSITVTVWIKARAFDEPWQAIINKGDSSWRLQRYEGKGSIEFACTGLNVTGTKWGNVWGTVGVNDGKWHHIAGIYNGTKIHLYVDGMLDKSLDASGFTNTNEFSVMVGENPEQRGRYWNGLIDDVRIYSYALSENEVKEVYAGRGPGPKNKSE